jgi:hypothetical protein
MKPASGALASPSVYAPPYADQAKRKKLSHQQSVNPVNFPQELTSLSFIVRLVKIAQ